METGRLRDVKFGLEGGKVCLRFDVEMTNGDRAYQRLGQRESINCIRVYQASDVQELEGRPCMIDTDLFGRALFAGPLA